MQHDLFTSPEPEIIIACDGRATLYRQWIHRDEAANLFDSLRQSLDWEQTVLTMYGRQVAIPRLNAWYGDSGSSYSYSGAYFDPMPWTAELANLRERLQAYTDTGFNSVLANYYRDGRDGVGWHSDNETELGPEPTIASVSLGETRRFSLRHSATGKTVLVDLAAGDLLVMSGKLQTRWQHQIAKSRKELGARINLTFRRVGEKG
ncbi:alpha-ketoglutarate-dependent dioxygenase AlkB [Gilvimarinus sp. SDUM040013]|uniref:Alpha-ketoglutarate-dependent dioxygenase AlkB n=1 Tax=Gilvimarinus gilvus TaxID=3058038 RepID=A0ABU4S170_9GAMM|nr:alpha-ketoglutarate-dependent dioxygenase AlkB [Gilvimarinus sp. SDUM040013]MDO3387145.1 alpha-ketoglutarate-dependent dioxygenase AlkB [Gilvimarinus sp. SDUM040013]MDX6850888.1 alpha-ketoglutarate-dependent dioxygenase AlkB [Gilvimarinus sp. SDUM040013]